jgi:DNA-binding response OmpR family regulator
VAQAGYLVHTAANAEDALALVRHSPPDLVILDIGLPGMDGLDALRKLKAQHNWEHLLMLNLKNQMKNLCLMRSRNKAR